MSKVKLPPYIEQLPDNLHERDMIRHYKKLLNKEVMNESPRRNETRH